AKENDLYVGDVEWDGSAGIYSMDLCVRVDDESGNFLGILKAVLNIEEVINIIKELERKAEEEIETREYKLLTKDGKIIYATEEYGFFEDISEELFPMFEMGEGERMIYYFTAEGDKPGEGEELFAHAHSKGYRNYKGLGWVLVIEHETEEIFAPIVGIKNTPLSISFMVIVVAVLIGLFISSSISKPIKKLTRNVDEISKGNFDVELEQNKIDEIKSLADSLNRVLASMKLAILRTGATKEELGLGKVIKAKQEAEKKAEKRLKELERFAKLAEGRELKMIELKKRIKELEKGGKKK
ncbi:MAG: HAMP domain-containing protein, partial [Planctomycetota bacterium]